MYKRGLYGDHTCKKSLLLVCFAFRYPLSFQRIGEKMLNLPQFLLFYPCALYTLYILVLFVCRLDPDNLLWYCPSRGLYALAGNQKICFLADFFVFPKLCAHISQTHIENPQLLYIQYNACEWGFIKTQCFFCSRVFVLFFFPRICCRFQATL